MANSSKVKEQAADHGETGMDVLPWSGARWAEAIADIGAEWLQFTANRVSRDVQTLHELQRATSIQEIQAIQSKFLQRAIDDYQAESGRMTQLVSDAMADFRTSTVRSGD